MKRSYISTLIMVVVLLGLARYYAYEKKSKPEKQAKEQATKQLVTIKSDEVQELTLERDASLSQSPESASAENVKIKKSGNEWNLVAPVQDLADSSAVNSLVSAVTTTKFDRVVEEKPKDLEEYGLKRPKIRISLKKSDSTPPEVILIGRDTPVGASVYASTGASETVYKVPASLKSSANRTLKDLRNKSILNNVVRNDITEVDLQNKTGSFILNKSQKDQWILSRENLPADSNEIGTLLSTLVDLKATDFSEKKTTDLKSFGLNNPSVKVTVVQGKDKPRVEVSIGTSADKVYSKRSDRNVIYVVDKSVLDKLARPSSAYRSTALANFNRFDTKKVTIARAKETIELKKEETNWSIAADTVTKLDDAKVDNLLAKIQDTKIAQYAPSNLKSDSAKTGLSHPVLSIRLYDKANLDKEEVLLKFGSRVGKLIYASRSGLDAVMMLKEEDFKQLDLSKADLLKKDDKAQDHKNDSPQPTKKSG